MATYDQIKSALDSRCGSENQVSSAVERFADTILDHLKQALKGEAGNKEGEEDILHFIDAGDEPVDPEKEHTATQATQFNSQTG